MKLNLGCGRKYKKGFVNIDLFDKTVCDKSCSITDLSFKDNSVELIEADQLIEHLGYIKSIYALSEWFRALKPKGRLIIETPDIEKSFRKYLEAKDEKTKREVLNWIFGHETLGYQHIFCFNFKTLKELLMKIGFANIKKEKPKTHLYEHSLRVICEKPQEYRLFQAFADARKEIYKEFSSILSNQIFAMELELKLDIARIDLSSLGKSRKEMLEKVFISLCRYSPKLAYIVFSALKKREIIDKNENSYEKLAKKLAAENLIQKEYSLLTKFNKKSKSQKITLKTLDIFLNDYILFLLGGKEKNSFVEYMEKIGIAAGTEKFTIFSEKIINDFADKNFSKAKKYYCLKDKARFKEFLETASLFNSDIKNIKVKAE